METTEETWRRSGMNEAGEEESIAFCAKLFADHLDGSPLRSNRSQWNRFVTLSNRNWYRLEARGPPLVLMGDAAHTAHFSIGSGTKLAMEDAAGLYQALQRQPRKHPIRPGQLRGGAAAAGGPVPGGGHGTAPGTSSRSAITCNWTRRLSPSIS